MKGVDTNLIDLMDSTMILGLETDVDTYNRIIEECTYWEGLFICIVFLCNVENKMEKARSIFNSYIDKQ